MNKKIKVLLIVSLVLNVFLLGFITGDVKKFRPRGGEGALFVKEFVKANHERQSELETERTKALNMIKADDFNMQEYQAQVEKISNIQGDMYKKFATNMAEKLRELPKEKRDAKIDRMLDKKGPFSMHKKFKNFGEHKKGKKPHKDKPRRDRAPKHIEAE